MPEPKQEFEEIQIGSREIADLKTAASNAPLRRARHCLHSGHEDQVQEMVIAICKDCYIAPHRQLGKTKSYVLLEGRMDLVFFEDDGTPNRRIALESPAGDKDCSALRFNSSHWHTVICLSSHAVYIESIAGPYRPENTDWADWAPQADDPAGIRNFLQAQATGNLK